MHLWGAYHNFKSRLDIEQQTMITITNGTNQVKLHYKIMCFLSSGRWQAYDMPNFAEWIKMLSFFGSFLYWMWDLK